MNYMLMRRYVNELDSCMARNPKSAFLQDKKSTMYYLNQYLDQQKHKKKWNDWLDGKNYIQKDSSNNVIGFTL